MKSVAFIKSNDWFTKSDIVSHGTHNGYVAVPPTSIYYDMTLHELNDKLAVHGGITFWEPVINGEKSRASNVYKTSAVGKRNGVLDGAEFLTENSEIGDDWRIMGFDTFHYDDDEMTWDRDNVKSETLYLLKQVEEIEP